MATNVCFRYGFVLLFSLLVCSAVEAQVDEATPSSPPPPSSTLVYRPAAAAKFDGHHTRFLTSVSGDECVNSECFDDECQSAECCDSDDRCCDAEDRCCGSGCCDTAGSSCDSCSEAPVGFTSQMASLLESSLSGKDIDDPTSQAAIRQAMQMVQERTQLEAAVEMALLDQDHRRQMAELSGRLMQANMKLNMLAEVKYWLEPVYTSQNQNNTQLSQLVQDHEKVKVGINQLRNELVAERVIHSNRGPDQSACTDRSPGGIQLSNPSSRFELTELPSQRSYRTGHRIANTFHREQELQELRRKIEVELSQLQRENHGIVYPESSLSPVRPVQHLQPLFDTNHQDTNHQDTNHQDTNHQDTNHQDTNHQDTNHQLEPIREAPNRR